MSELFKKIGKAYRPANIASFRRNLTKTLIQTFFFWTIFLFSIPGILVFTQNHFGISTFYSKAYLGIILFFLGGSIGLSAGITMAYFGKGTPLPIDCPRKLVVGGPYAYVRNPMAIGGIIQGIAVGVYLGSWLVLIYALLGIPTWHFFARLSKESDMRDRFGVEFENYKQSVRVWLPRLTKYTPQI